MARTAILIDVCLTAAINFESFFPRGIMMRTTCDEQVLVEALVQGDKEAFQSLYTQYSGLFLTIARRYARSHAEAEDLTQEAFVQIYRKVHTFNGNGSFEGWMKRVVVNKCLTALKKKNLYSDVSIDDVAPQAQKTSSSFPIEKMSAEDILAAFEELPAGVRTVLNLYAIEGYDHREISEELGITESASRSQLTKARARLKVILEAKNLLG